MTHAATGAMQDQARSIPVSPISVSPISVSIVTGFLGSGKTTLISRLLRDPALAGTAVIVNEFGEIGLDHDLIASSDESLLALTTGCLCCAVQTDLARTLLDLHTRRAAGTAAYDRVLIETSGLAEPAPILHALMTDAALAQTHALTSVITVIDSVHGPTTLHEHPAARHQLAVADWLLLSKTDVAAPAAALMDTIRALNPGAEVQTTAEAAPALFFQPRPVDALAARLAELPPMPADHTAGIQNIVLQRDAPLPALALTLFLQALAEHAGARLLRMKGLIGIAEMPGRPAVIHGVRHVVSPPDFLDRWPGEDTGTRIVFISMGMPRWFPARLLDAIEAEVLDETATGAS
ncbi:CobW family GTP-binding protein [Rhodopila sp.]|jgi:G3E family GTPase|uniref:CobW family GTP-binding protein n=1 Tax=Rhodopila sp. TaxID=2480087 RepID=UPI002C7FC096|nr:GTP-binding protein [Rhodopila sp.]HVZ07120.1 GTP-binding protein [Rhodopila sp.]